MQFGWTLRGCQGHSSAFHTLFSSTGGWAGAEAFMNCQGQWQTVTAALTEHLRHVVYFVDPAFGMEYVKAPRRILFLFNGVDGIRAEPERRPRAGNRPGRDRQALDRRVSPSAASASHTPLATLCFSARRGGTQGASALRALFHSGDFRSGPLPACSLRWTTRTPNRWAAHLLRGSGSRPARRPVLAAAR